MERFVLLTRHELGNGQDMPDLICAIQEIFSGEINI
jgi:hypothetical protein